MIPCDESFSQTGSQPTKQPTGQIISQSVIQSVNGLISTPPITVPTSDIQAGPIRVH